MASSILNSDDGVISGTSGIKAVGGDDGVLVFQSKGTETARVNTDKQIVAAAGTASLPVLTTTGDLNTGIYFPAADNIGFATGGTIRGRWTDDGLCFGSDTAAANALDDYEEGSFTPALEGSSSNPTVVYFGRSGRYTKIGNVVTVNIEVYVNTFSGGTGTPFITGLPFTSLSGGGYQAGSITWWSQFDSNIVSATIYMPANATRLEMIGITAATSSSIGNRVAVDDLWKCLSEFGLSITYRV